MFEFKVIKRNAIENYRNIKSLIEKCKLLSEL